MKFLPHVSTECGLFYGDNLLIMQQLLNIGYRGQFDMIYFDGPFNSGWVFSLYDEELEEEIVDPWSEAKTIEHFYQPHLYRESYRKRIEVARELLKDQGILVFHTSQKEGHYLKVILDEVFGSGRFLGEAIWKFADGPVYRTGQFGLNHETLFFYAKTKDYLKIPGTAFPSVWDDLGTYEQIGTENTFYATQKPLKLMERILQMTTKEQALVGDFYCGSGSMAYAAEKMNRRWIASDHSRISIRTARERLAAIGVAAPVYQLVEDFNRDYLQGHVYTKHSTIPFSLHELQGLKREMAHLPVTVRAYEYTPDIDLLGDETVQFQMIMPSRTHHLAGHPDHDTDHHTDHGSDYDTHHRTGHHIVPRPVPIRGENGYQLLVPEPLEWIDPHIKHGMFVDDQYVIDEPSVQERVRKLYQKMYEKWIKSETEYEHHVLLIDRFGYSYYVSKSK